MFRLTAFTAVVLLGWPGSILLSQDSPVPLTGVIDFHVHAGPDSRPRSLNDIEAVRLAQQAGLRGVVLKNHFTMTADRALLAMNHVEDLEVFGGVVLNRAVGGINPEAVRQMVAFDGGRGKVVWLPTFDAEFYVTREGGANPFVRVVENGTPVSSLIEIFSLIAEHGLVLAMGHSSPEEVILLIDAAKRQGVSRILVTHVFGQDASRDQMMQMAANGAVMELDWLAVYSGTLSITDYTSAIRELGAEHFLISSDLGQAGNPAHADGLRSFIRTLKESGVTDSEIDLMARRNPARLLGLD